MLKLEERREALEKQLTDVGRQLDSLKASLSEDSPAAVRKERSTRPARRTRAPRGSLKDRIHSQLKAAGSDGLTVREISEQLGTTRANIYSWLNTTGKKDSSIKKANDGRYTFSPGAAAAPAKAGAAAKPARRGRKARPAKPAKPAAKKAPTKAAGRNRPGGRGKLMAAILGELKAAGTKGITVKELSAKLGVAYKNVYIWFVTTGKKNPNIKRIGPARYALVG